MEFNPITQVYIGGAGGFVPCVDYNRKYAGEISFMLQRFIYKSYQ